jgi:hypothetical protein
MKIYAEQGADGKWLHVSILSIPHYHDTKAEGAIEDSRKIETLVKVHKLARARAKKMLQDVRAVAATADLKSVEGFITYLTFHENLRSISDIYQAQVQPALEYIAERLEENL